MVNSVEVVDNGDGTFSLPSLAETPSYTLEQVQTYKATAQSNVNVEQTNIDNATTAKAKFQSEYERWEAIETAILAL